MAKHTPGPWTATRLIDNQGEPYATNYVAHVNLDVCMVWAPPGNVEQEANAKLIAAAPDMLFALQNITWALHDEHGDAPIFPDSALAGCIDAINKATGV